MDAELEKLQYISQFIGSIIKSLQEQKSRIDKKIALKSLTEKMKGVKND